MNEKLCQARPVDDTLSLQEKNSRSHPQEITREVDQLLRNIFNDRRRSERLDLEATETQSGAARR